MAINAGSENSRSQLDAKKQASMTKSDKYDTNFHQKFSPKAFLFTEINPFSVRILISDFSQAQTRNRSLELSFPQQNGFVGFILAHLVYCMPWVLGLAQLA